MIALLVGCVLPATPPTRLPRIGYLAGTASAGQVEAFRRGLRDLGWIEGENILVEYRSADAQVELYADLVDELVRMPVDIIVASSTPGALAARDRAVNIPVVLAIGGDPVALGLIANLAHPGANITGVTSASTATSSKRVELLKTVVPRLS